MSLRSLPPALAMRYRRRLQLLVLGSHARQLECRDTWLAFCGTGA